MLYKLFIDDMRNAISHAYLTRSVQENIKIKIRAIESCFNTWVNRLNKSEKRVYKEDINSFREDLKAILKEIYKN